jgi:two-component system, cell cycle sensor histidine kinase and response regulator CckA
MLAQGELFTDERKDGHCGTGCPLMLDSTPMGFFEASRDGEVLRCNDTLAKLLGFPSADGLRGRPLAELLSERDGFDSWLATLGGGRVPSLREFRFRRQDGGVLSAMMHAWLRPAGPERAPHVIGMLLDLSEQKNAESNAQRREVHFRSLVENASDFITTLGEDGRILYQSPSIQRTLDYDAADLLGHSVFEFVHEDDRPAVLDALQRTRLKPGVTRSVAFRVLHRDGSWRELESLGQALTLETGQTATIVNSRDVTERRRLEAAMCASEARFRAFFDDDLAGNFICTPDGRLVVCNQAFATMFGFRSVEEAMRADASRFFSDPQTLGSLLPRLRQEGAIRRLELRLQRLDGTPVHVVENAVGEFDADGELTLIRGHLLDETAYKRLEAQLLQSQRMEAVGSLAGGVAHDFNNILTTIIGYGQIALSKLPPDLPLTHELGEVLRAGHRAAALTRQLLAFGRMQFLQPRVLRLDVVALDLEKMLRRLIGEDVELVIVPNRSASLVKADPGQVEQVIMNLVVNARDALPTGGKIVVETSDVELGPGFAHHGFEYQPGRYVMLSVTDDGHGMDAGTQARVFEPFFTTKERGKGTGLGLSMVYGIVKQSGGYITVYSEPGVGTAFKVYLPRVDEAVDPCQARSADEEMPRGWETVLVVEDEAQVRALAARVLREQGYTVLEAADGQEGLRAARAHGMSEIGLVLTDVVMPRMDGRELAEELQRSGDRIPILYTSGYPDETIARHGILSPELEFLQKPYTLSALAKKVRTVLDGRGRGAA